MAEAIVEVSVCLYRCLASYTYFPVVGEMTREITAACVNLLWHFLHLHNDILTSWYISMMSLV